MCVLYGEVSNAHGRISLTNLFTPLHRTRSNSALEDSPLSPCPNKRRKEDKKEEKFSAASVASGSDSNGSHSKFDLTRQPLLQGLTSNYDLELFLEAQVKFKPRSNLRGVQNHYEKLRKHVTFA